MPKSLGYRPEIDGLRAIAVISVIMYHAGVRWLPAGFLGVDIFFVISGYLITTILLGDLTQDRFSILRFYERRARRILPALMLVILLTFVGGYFLLLPDDLENLGQSIVATVLFSNNVLLFLTSGYFDLSIEFKPLMHTWSLGVEEHYYVLVPLVMYLLYRLGGRRSVAIGLTILSVVSFGFCLWAVKAAPIANFYLLPSRAWELGAGSMLALAEPRLRARMDAHGRIVGAAAAAGLVLIVASMVVLDESYPMPGWPALAPVSGACMVILFGHRPGIANSLLSTRPMVGLGLISYSAYLFHQPIFAFARLAMLEQPTTGQMLTLIPLVLLCAYASWRWVERPFRRPSLRPMRLWSLAGASSAVALAAGGLLVVTSGLYNRWPELKDRDGGFGVGQNIAYNTGPGRFEKLPFPANGALNVLVIGDSFARDFINMGLETGALSGRNISLWHIGPCPGATLPAQVAALARQADLIVVSAAFDDERARCIADRAGALRRLNPGPVVVVGTKSFGWNNNAVMLLPAATRYAYRAKPIAATVTSNEVAKRLIPPSVYIDVIGMLCDAEGRVPVFTPNHMLISQDRAHLTRAGARYVGDIVFRHPALRILHDRAVPPPRPKADPA